MKQIKKAHEYSWNFGKWQWKHFFEKGINILIGSFVGVFVGHGIYIFGDYKAHFDLYAMQSAPWYISILVHGIFTIVILIAAIIIKLIIRRKLKQ